MDLIFAHLQKDRSRRVRLDPTAFWWPLRTQNPTNRICIMRLEYSCKLWPRMRRHTHNHERKVPRSRTRWECDVKASGNDRVIWRVPLHRKSNIIEWVLRLDDFLKQTGSKAILSPRRASGRLVLGWLWSSEGKGQDGFDVHQVWPFVTVSSTGPNRLEFVLVFRESVPRGLYA